MRRLPVAAVLAIAFASAACGGVDARQSPTPPATGPSPSAFSLPSVRSQYVAAQSANIKFGVRYDQADYHAIYLMLDQSYRSRISEEQLTSLLTSTRERLGASGRTRERSYETSPLGDGGDLLVTFVMDSTFEKGTALQTFSWRVTPSNVTYLMRYQIE